jgi:cAMP-dependent protein kinase regulator
MSLRWEELKLPDQKRKYIEEKVQPLLEELAKLCVTQQPNDPAKAICDYIRETRHVQLPVDFEVERLREEVEALKPQTPTSIPEQPAGKSVSSRRGAISNESFGPWSKRGGLMAIAHPKNLEQRGKFRKSLMEASPLIRALPSAAIEILIDALQEVKVAAGDKVVVRGETARNIFILETGALTKSGIILRPGQVIDGVSLLASSPWKETIEAAEESIIWKLDRETFANVVQLSAEKEREATSAVIKKMEILKYDYN